jgi:hypothetical protein
MLHIDEQALTLLLQTGAITQIELRPVGRGYGVFVCMDRKEDGPSTATLITARMKHQKHKQPRTWSTTDACVQFLKGKAQELPSIKIDVNQGGDDTKTTSHHPQ